MKTQKRVFFEILIGLITRLANFINKEHDRQVKADKGVDPFVKTVHNRWGNAPSEIYRAKFCLDFSKRFEPFIKAHPFIRMAVSSWDVTIYIPKIKEGDEHYDPNRNYVDLFNQIVNIFDPQFSGSIDTHSDGVYYYNHAVYQPPVGEMSPVSCSFYLYQYNVDKCDFETKTVIREEQVLAGLCKEAYASIAKRKKDEQ